MMLTTNYDRRFHFFTNDGTNELKVSCSQGLINAQNGIREGQHIRAFLGFIELGVIEVFEELEMVRIGESGLSSFTREKTGNRYLLIALSCFDKMIREDTSLEKFLQLMFPEIVFHIGSEEESDKWCYYDKAMVSRYIRYSHPLCSTEEMQRMRESEKRIIFWDMKNRHREKLWFVSAQDAYDCWKLRFNIKNAEDLKKECQSHKNVIAFLGNIQIGEVWHQENDDIFLFDSGFGLGKVFLYEDDCFALEPKQLNAFLNRNISLEEFIHTAYGESNGGESQYEIVIADDAKAVWQYIQDGWTFIGRIKDIMCNTGYISSSQERFSEESRVLFVKGINS